MLRAVDDTTVERLAEALGVTTRTVHRDLATLRDRGVPIEGTAGAGGGVRLLGDRGITGVHLSVAEVVSLWLSARLSAAASQLPWSASARSALGKLLSSLSRARARELRRVLDRVIVGPSPSAATVASMDATSEALLGVVEQAFTLGCAMQFAYTDRNGRISRRRIQPHALFVQPPLWYLLAYDLDRRAPRTMRMDRVREPRVLRSETFVPDVELVRSLLSDVPGPCRALSHDVLDVRRGSSVAI